MAPDPQPPTFPSSRSLYRGQSSTGLGEGPGNPIRDGEQYLHGSDNGLAHDADLLRSARPWMSFDADPADVQRLGDRLEGWSCTRIGPWQMIARLRPAGIYDRRTAYFTHGRFWRFADLPPAMDPGAHLGRAEGFAAPFRDEATPNGDWELFPEMVRPEQINENQEAAVHLLANLIDAIQSKRNLIVVAATAEFATGSPFHALLSFARTALPANLKPACRARIYTRNPELFLSRGSPEEAQLLAIPEWVADSAAAARRDAIFVDSRGRSRQGKGPDSAAHAYAAAVVGRAIRIPRGLVLFTERHSRWAPKSGQHEQAIQIHYNLAYAFEKPQERAGDLLRKYLLQKAQSLPPWDWSTLIGDEEWSLFPQEALFDLIFTPDSELQPGGIRLRQTLAQAAAHQQLDARENLERWWEPGDPTKEERLLQLVAGHSSMIPQDLASSWIARISADRLAELAEIDKILEVLIRLTVENRLGFEWLDRLLKSQTGDWKIEGVARILLQHAKTWRNWPKASLKLFFNRLLDTSSENNSDLGPQLLAAASQLDPSSSADLLLPILELAARRGENVSSAIGTFGRSLTQVETAARPFLVQAALSPKWVSIGPEWLFRDGQLAAEWIGEYAGTILDCEQVRHTAASAPIDALLHLGKFVDRQDGLLTYQFYEALDIRVRLNLEKATSSLIRQGWWFTWRHKTALDKEELRQIAFHWLSSDAWGLPSPPEPGLEEWRDVLNDIGDTTLSDQEILQLRRRAGDPTWPWIRCFEEDQINDLFAHVQNYGALAELAALAEKNSIVGRKAWDLAGQSRLLRGRLPGDALKYLLEKRQEQPLGLKESELLYEGAGHQLQRALEARRDSALYQLRSYHSRPSDLTSTAVEALQAAASPNLWTDIKFLTGLAEWIGGFGGLTEPNDEILTTIEDYLPGEARHKSTKSLQAQARNLVERGFPRIGTFLSTDIVEKTRLDGLPREICEALSDGLPGAECWDQLRSNVFLWLGNKKKGEHPLGPVLREIKNAALEAGQRRQLRANGPATFVRILSARENSCFLAQDSKGLPAVTLHSELLGPGSRGMAAGAVFFSPAAASYFEDDSWWRALIHEIFAGSTAEDLPQDSMDYLLSMIRRFIPEMADVFERQAEKYAPGPQKFL